MNNLIYLIFLIGGLGIYFTFTRGSVIDLKTEYVPNNIVIGSYGFAIVAIILSSIVSKSFTPILNSLGGFFVSFVIPYAFVNGVYYFQYFSLKRKLKKQNIPLEIEKEETLKENPVIDKQFYVIIYLVSFILLTIISIISERYYLIGIGALTLGLELIIGRLLRRYCVIEYNHAEDQMKALKDEKNALEKEVDEITEIGIGDGDIILFGVLGIMFSGVGFVISFIYAVFAQIFVIILFSLIKKVNPFKYKIPFIPALAIGTLIFTTGFDQYLFNFVSLINNLF